MNRSLSRRLVLGGASASVLLGRFSRPALAVTTDEAAALVERLIADINRIIASGETEAQMLAEFDTLFGTYADVPTIARYTLGSDARSASADQLAAFTAAFRGYISRRYGRRFREFIGGEIRFQKAQTVPNGIEVQTMAFLQGQSPFRVDFLVSDKSGKVLFFNIVIEGVNMLLSERTEIGAMLDQRGGDLNKLIADINKF